MHTNDPLLESLSSKCVLVSNFKIELAVAMILSYLPNLIKMKKIMFNLNENIYHISNKYD